MKTTDLLNIAQVIYYLAQSAEKLNEMLPKDSKERNIRDEYPDYFAGAYPEINNPGMSDTP